MPNQPQATSARKSAGTFAPRTPNDARASTAIAEGIAKPRDGNHWWGDYGSPLRDAALSYTLLQRHKIPRRRWNTNALGTWTLGRIAGVRWEDSQCGFRMVRKKVLDRFDLRSRGFAIEMEMAMKAADWNLRWAHVPVQAIYHDAWASHFRGALDTYLIAFASLSC